MKTIKIMLSLVIMLVLQACGSESAETGTVNSSNRVEVVDPYVDAGCRQPLSVAVLDDRSGSRPQFGIAPFETGMLTPFLNHIGNCGGSLMFGIIEADSRMIQPVYLRVPRETLQRPEPPEEPNMSDYQSDFAYSAAMDDYNEQLSNHRDALSRHRDRLSLERGRIENHTVRFREQVEELTSREFDDRETDIVNAINHTFPFHATAVEASRKLTIVLSDGIHTRGNNQLQTQSGGEIEYYLVPGSVGLEQPWVEQAGAQFIPDFTTLMQIIGLEYTGEEEL